MECGLFHFSLFFWRMTISESSDPVSQKRRKLVLSEKRSLFSEEDMITHSTTTVIRTMYVRPSWQRHIYLNQIRMNESILHLPVLVQGLPTLRMISSKNSEKTMQQKDKNLILWDLSTHRKKDKKISYRHNQSSSRPQLDRDSVFFFHNMYHFEYHQKSWDNLQKTKDRYPWLTQRFLSDESIEARYHLLEYLRIYHGYRGILEKDTKGKPIRVNTLNGTFYWSISHSKNYIAYSISDAPTGIDIAEYRERDDSLLDIHTDSEYRILWGQNWNNFYILWTAKEALIKAQGHTLDDVKAIQLQQIQEGDLALYWFLGKTYTIKQEQHGLLFLSITH